MGAKPIVPRVQPGLEGWGADRLQDLVIDVERHLLQAARPFGAQQEAPLNVAAPGIAERPPQLELERPALGRSCHRQQSRGQQGGCDGQPG